MAERLAGLVGAQPHQQADTAIGEQFRFQNFTAIMQPGLALAIRGIDENFIDRVAGAEPVFDILQQLRNALPGDGGKQQARLFASGLGFAGGAAIGVKQIEFVPYFDNLSTPLFVVLLMLETTDLVFAVDSVPAVLAITTDPFIVYTSNVFAILGLRSLFFALAGVMQLFHHLHHGLAAVLVFIGAKMLLDGFYKIPTLASLLVIVGLLAVAVVVSVLWPKKIPVSPLPAR